MKRFFVAICVVTAGLLAACNSWIDSSINTDPTSPKDASYDVVLPTIQAGMGYVMGGDLGRTTSLLTQHNTGVDRQQLGIYNYQLKESDVDNAWRFNLYGGPLNDMYIMMQEASADGSPHYVGVAQVMMVHTMGTITDLWGDVPFSNAFGGATTIQPKYDSQEQIYTALQAMLDAAIANLSAASSTMSPGGDDLIYGGDLAMWTKAAHSLKARYAIHLAKRDAAAASKALASVANGFSSNADDMQFTFGTVQTEANPWYQFNQQRDGDLTFGVKLSEVMNATSDPRRPFYAEPDDSNEYSSLSRMGPFYSSINSPVPFATYTELKFIEAEAQMRMNNASGAHAAYLDGVKASLERTGVAAADVSTFMEQTSIDPGAANLTLELIMTQKYVAMYTHPDSYADWRRTGFPVLTPTVQNSEIPRRFPYAQSERLFNEANMNADGRAGLTIFDRVWWDMP